MNVSIVTGIVTRAKMLGFGPRVVWKVLGPTRPEHRAVCRAAIRRVFNMPVGFAMGDLS